MTQFAQQKHCHRQAGKREEWMDVEHETSETRFFTATGNTKNTRHTLPKPYRLQATGLGVAVLSPCHEALRVESWKLAASTTS